ncbi:MAG: hypothetical protein IT521_14620 [Burkholderiales bacterium]|nr:hypothetical protein [Burkholderiales bacterium]
MAFSRLATIIVIGCCVSGTAFAASPALDRIKSSGTVTFGYREAAAPLVGNDVELVAP